MTYTLFECLKDKVDEILENVTELAQIITAEATEAFDDLDLNQGNKAAKKEQLTKAQKRRLWSKTDHAGNKPRGWDWVDLVKHLSQTGGKPDDSVNFVAS